MGVMPVALEISPDEPCWGLKECDRLLPMPDGSIQRRRVQAVYVIRGDAIAEHLTDLGPAEDWQDVEQQVIVSFGDDRVGEMREWAEADRESDFWRKRRREIQESSTLIRDFLEEKERNWKLIRNQSVFGPGISRQRNGFPYHEIQKQAWRPA